MAEPELLQIGAEPPSRRSPRARIALLVLVVALAAAGVLVDHGYRVREQRAVGACAREVATAVDLAGRPIHAAYEYIRPVLANGPDREQERALYLLVAKAARHDENPGLATATRTCHHATALAWHDSLERRRDRCIAVLAQQREELRAIARDGASVLAWMDAPRTC